MPTKSALKDIEKSKIFTVLSRHEQFDWGRNVTIITKGDRSCTTILLPYEFSIDGSS